MAVIADTVLLLLEVRPPQIHIFFEMRSFITFSGILATLSAILLSSLLSPVLSDEILGCGGFVKLSPSLKGLVGSSKAAKKRIKKTISNVKVQMVSLSGAVQDETSCAPNGYYFLPIYDTTGKFQLRVKGPLGWSVVQDTFDITASSDEIQGCGTDVNFEFTGFAVSGSLGVAGSKNVCTKARLRNQNLKLVDNKNKDISHKAQTNDEGGFIFEGVTPGEYSFEFESDGIGFSSNSKMSKVKVIDGSVAFSETLLTDGLAVSGRVKGDVPGVQVFLYGKPNTKAKPRNCDPITSMTKLPSSKPPKGQRPLCVGKTTEKGEFSFFGLPCGEKYVVVPYFEGEHTSFNVEPTFTRFKVDDTNVELDPFVITGFSIGGSVVDHLGNGIANAKVTVDGLPSKDGGILITDKSGNFKLNNVREGRYNVKVVKKGMTFGDLSGIKIKPSTTGIKPFKVSGYSVCGRVEGKSSKRVTVTLFDSGTEAQISKTKPSTETGQFCFEGVPAGEYFVRINAPRGTILTPKQHDIDVVGPMDGISFGPSKVKVSGSVICLTGKSCKENLSVRLTSQTSKEEKTTKVVDNSFAFTNISPGRYFLEAFQTNKDRKSCWGTKEVAKNIFSQFDASNGKVKVDVGVKNIDDLVLRQVGHVVNIQVNEAMDVKIGRTKKKKSGKKVLIKGENTILALRNGLNKVCVPGSGTYTVYSTSCYNFASSSYNIKAPRDASDITKVDVAGVRIEGHVTGTTKAIRPIVTLTGMKDAEAISSKVDINGDFALVAPQGSEQISLEVRSDHKEYLISPSKVIKITIPASGCPKKVPPFVLKKGLVLNGEIKPKLAGVAVALQKTSGDSGDDSEDVTWKTVETFESDRNGQWSAGPLDTDSRYRVVASKDGYNFQAPIEITKSVAKSKIVLHHSKLASLKIIVKDANDVTGLQGVLLSLSGDDYRNNDVTGDDGVLKFQSLFPGSYYVRPMLKEYEFTPKSNSFDLESSSNTVFEFKAKRVAFSIFGTLSTIVGEPSVDTIVVAIDSTSKEILEAVSNSDGEYRMRGLKPGRKYAIKVNGRKKKKSNRGGSGKGSGISNAVQTIPQELEITMDAEDLHDLDFVVQNTPTHARLTGVINVKDEYVKDLSVVLSRASNPKAAIKRAGVSLSKYFEFPKVSAGKYILRVESKALSSKHFLVKSNDLKVTVPSRMEAPSVHTELDFTVSIVSIDDEVDSGNFFTLLFGGLAVYIYANSEWAFRFFLPVLKILAELPLLGPVISKRLPNESRASEGVGGFTMGIDLDRGRKKRR